MKKDCNLIFHSLLLIYNVFYAGICSRAISIPSVIPPPQGICRKVRRHFWLLQLGDSGGSCSWYRVMGCWSLPVVPGRPPSKCSPSGKCEEFCYGEILFRGAGRTMLLLRIPETNYMPDKLKFSPPPTPKSPLVSTLFSSSVLMACFFRKLDSLGISTQEGLWSPLLPILIFLQWRFNHRSTPGHARLPLSCVSISFLLDIDTLE